MYKHKARKKQKYSMKNTNLIQRLEDVEMDIKRLQLELSWLQDKNLYSNTLIEEKIRDLEHQFDKEPF